jgi:hypothetical protein
MVKASESGPVVTQLPAVMAATTTFPETRLSPETVQAPLVTVAVPKAVLGDGLVLYKVIVLPSASFE